MLKFFLLFLKFFSFVAYSTKSNYLIILGSWTPEIKTALVCVYCVYCVFMTRTFNYIYLSSICVFVRSFFQFILLNDFCFEIQPTVHRIRSKLHPSHSYSPASSVTLYSIKLCYFCLLTATCCTNVRTAMSAETIFLFTQTFLHFYFLLFNFVSLSCCHSFGSRIRSYETLNYDRLHIYFKMGLCFFCDVVVAVVLFHNWWRLFCTYRTLNDRVSKKRPKFDLFNLFLRFASAVGLEIIVLLKLICLTSVYLLQSKFEERRTEQNMNDENTFSFRWISF